MITHWDKRWDDLPDQETFYTKRLIDKQVLNNLVENASTLFIKIKILSDETKVPERAWVGYVYDFRDEKDKVRFKVSIEREISLAEVPHEYFSLKEGWYMIDWSLRRIFSPDHYLYPPFFYSLLTTKDWQEFEKYVFMLLKLIGIHNIHRYVKQKGQPDGFFVFGKHLAVIYDCTLEKDFEKEKSQQIHNYVNQLRAGVLKPGREKEYDIKDYNKQVWIITRGTTRLIKKIYDIQVKEVSINKLIEIYGKRIEEDLDEEDLEIMLTHI
jgi:hypothetical protein